MHVQVTLALQPMFKRSVTFLTRDDSDMTEKVSVWGRLHEFGDMTWLPYQRKVVYRQDDRVDVATPGDAINDFLGFRAQAKLSQFTARLLGTAYIFPYWFTPSIPNYKSFWYILIYYISRYNI